MQRNFFLSTKPALNHRSPAHLHHPLCMGNSLRPVGDQGVVTHGHGHNVIVDGGQPRAGLDARLVALQTSVFR